MTTIKIHNKLCSPLPHLYFTGSITGEKYSGPRLHCSDLLLCEDLPSLVKSIQNTKNKYMKYRNNDLW